MPLCTVLGVDGDTTFGIVAVLPSGVLDGRSRNRTALVGEPKLTGAGEGVAFLRFCTRESLDASCVNTSAALNSDDVV